jgi:hypothetical protein
MPYTFHVKGTTKEFELCTFQTRATAGSSEHFDVRTSGMTGVGLGVGVRDGVRVIVGVLVFVGVGVRVFVGVGVFVFVGVGVLVGVFVGAASSDTAPIQAARTAGMARRMKREAGAPVVMRTSLARDKRALTAERPFSGGRRRIVLERPVLGFAAGEVKPRSGLRRRAQSASTDFRWRSVLAPGRPGGRSHILAAC